MRRVTGIGGVFFKTRDAVPLRAEGCNVLDWIEASEFGRFAWVIDPEGNKVESWEPPPGR